MLIDFARKNDMRFERVDPKISNSKKHMNLSNIKHHFWIISYPPSLFNRGSFKPWIQTHGGDPTNVHQKWLLVFPVAEKANEQWMTGWCFQLFFNFHPENWGNDPIWLIFFNWVETIWKSQLEKQMSSLDDQQRVVATKVMGGFFAPIGPKHLAFYRILKKCVCNMGEVPQASLFFGVPCWVSLTKNPTLVPRQASLFQLGPLIGYL